MINEYKTCINSGKDVMVTMLLMMFATQWHFKKCHLREIDISSTSSVLQIRKAMGEFRDNFPYFFIISYVVDPH